MPLAAPIAARVQGGFSSAFTLVATCAKRLPGGGGNGLAHERLTEGENSGAKAWLRPESRGQESRGVLEPASLTLT